MPHANVHHVTVQQAIETTLGRPHIMNVLHCLVQVLHLHDVNIPVIIDYVLLSAYL